MVWSDGNQYVCQVGAFCFFVQLVEDKSECVLCMSFFSCSLLYCLKKDNDLLAKVYNIFVFSLGEGN